MAHILVFGASMTYGAWDREGGWVQRLRKFLDEKTLTDSDFFYLVYNLGISGDSTEELLKRFEFETEQRLDEEEETIFIFAIGANDAQFVHSQNSLRTKPEKFKRNMQKLINTARKFSSQIVFVGLVPVDESKTAPIPWNRDVSYKNKYSREYNATVKSVCKENKIHFIEVFEKFEKTDYKKLLEDGLHPTSSGHEKIFETVKDFLIKNKII